MENTKDLIFEVVYNEQTETLEFAKERKAKKGLKEKILKSIKEHKIVSTLVTMTVALMAIDIIMIYKFVQVLVQ